MGEKILQLLKNEIKERKMRAGRMKMEVKNLSYQ